MRAPTASYERSPPRHPERAMVPVTPNSRPGAQTARYVGYALVLVFFALKESATSYNILFQGTLTSSSAGEVHFWLAHAMLLFPACLLLGYGFAPQIGTVLERVAARIRAMSRRERVLGTFGLF